VRCFLLYNPTSGRKRSQRAEQIRRIADALSGLGHQVDVAATTAAGSATVQTHEAVRAGAEIVFACGGDGTVHEVLQSLTSESGAHRAALGIIPMGSENALARNLGISLDPVSAALEQIRSTARTIPLGKIAYEGGFRYFVLMAGVGPSGALAYSLLSADKSKLGRVTYYLRAARLFVTRRFHCFEVEYADAASGVTVRKRAVSAMAVRVGSLGGLFGKLTGGQASVEDTDLQIILISPPGLISLPLWFLSSWLNLRGPNRLFRSIRVRSFSCWPISASSPHFQADGEWLGRIPIEVSIVQDAVRILLPDEFN
jgi:diacylglycerol kinase (ATP)